MKNFKYIACFLIMIFASTLLVGCNNPPLDHTLNISYSELQTLATSTDPNGWNKLSATRIDSNGTETILINKSTTSISPASFSPMTLSTSLKVDYIKENSEEKVYCKDNIRHHQGKDSYGRDRNYIDESEFDGQEFIDETILAYLQELYEFFNDDNAQNLIYSDSTINGNNTIVEFRANINTSNNTVLKTILTLHNDILIKIKVEITSDDSSKEITTELLETTEVVNTPDWFDNNDFKTEISYDEMKSIALAEDFSDWDAAELFLPINYSGEAEDQHVFTSKSQNKTYIITESTKSYFDGSYLYSYIDNEPISKEDISTNQTLNNKYLFDIIFNTYRTSAYGYFFLNEPQYEGYYQTSKKYERDITVLSYKYSGVSGNTKFESICSLYYDLDENLYQILCYAKQIDITDPENEIVVFDMNLSLKKINEFSIPNWFDESHFEIIN